MRMRNVTKWVLGSSLCLAAVNPALADGEKKAPVLEKGKVTLESAGAIAFAPSGVLLVADPMAARVVAIATDDGAAGSDAKSIAVGGLDTKIAAALGTTAQDIRIVDLAVHPVSGNAYLSVARGTAPDAPGVLVRVDHQSTIGIVDLDLVRHAAVTLEAVPARDAVSGRSRERARLQSITDLAYVDGQVLVAGMSNEEFASTLRSIPYPFGSSREPTSVEIYHGAHGRFETQSPVRTFVSLVVGGEPHILAAYQCTPLVSIPLAELKPGAKVKGRTIAELGNRNRPLDMIVYDKGGSEFMLIANNSRGVMKIKTTDLEKAPEVSSRVEDGKSEGVPYETLADWKNIHQLDRADLAHALVVRQSDSGALDLATLPLP